MAREPTVFRRGMRLMWRYIKGQPGPFTISVTGATIFALSAVGTAVVLGRVTDEVLVPAFDQGVTARAVWGAVIALAAVSILRAVSIVLRRYFGAMTGRRTQAGLRRQVTSRYLRVPISYHQATPTGQLLAHADADVEAATEVIYPLPFTVGVTALIGFSLISLLAVDPLLTVVALLLFPALALINRLYTSRVETPAAAVQADVGAVSSIAHESIDGAMVVKTLGREDDEVERLSEAADRLRRSRIGVGRLRAAFEPVIDALPNVGIIALLALGSWEISTDRITTGELVQAIALFGILAFPMRVVGFFLEEMPRSVVSIRRIDGVLAEPSAPVPDPSEVEPLPDGPLGVELDHVTFGYGDGPVLTDLSLRVEPGEIVAIVGSTGSGKTTLCDLLVRSADPERGAIRLGGVDIRHVDPTRLRQAVALVFQESFLFAETIAGNIALDGSALEDIAPDGPAVDDTGPDRPAPDRLDTGDGGHGRAGESDGAPDEAVASGATSADDRVRAAARVARADEFVAELPQGYDTVVGERGVTLSGGQRQRVALARALVRAPQVLVLDDATSAVDPVVEGRILAGLRSTLSTTTLIVAHRISTIELADRVVYVDAGRVVATGTHQELLRLPAYEAIVRAYEEAGPAIDDAAPVAAERAAEGRDVGAER